MTRRVLHYGDNLEVLRNMPGASVDLIYLDPPFNSNADYNVIFREHTDNGGQPQAQITAFEDTWQWGPEAARALNELVAVHGELAEYLDFTVRRLGHNSLSAYLVMMAPRLVELHRVLKDTGSIYLHCDPTASHYLKVLLDAIFGPTNFRNEIIWKRSSAHSDAKQGRKGLGRIHDTILFYSKTAEYTWNHVHVPYDDDYLASKYRLRDPDGRLFKDTDLTARKPGGDTSYEWRIKRSVTKGSRWVADLSDEHFKPKVGWEYRGVLPSAGRFWAYSKANMMSFAEEGLLYHTSTGTPRLKQYADEMPGVPLQDLWVDIPPVNSQARERLGYPTQKPVALLERIVAANSNPGDVVLDPFCGCGTAVAAAEKMGRSWVGIDITHLAVGLIAARLKRDFGLESGQDFQLEGTPQDLSAARYLFEHDSDGPYQFQFWINGVIGAQSYGAGATGKGKRGGDTGIDGKMYFRTPGGEKLESVIVSVKGGRSLNPSMVRDLESVVRREKAAMGVFVTLEEPTAGMRAEAAKHGFYRYGQAEFPRVQLLTVAEILDGKRPQMPAGAANISLEAAPQKSLRTDPRSKAMHGLFDEAPR